MSVEENRTQASLLALEFLVSRLIAATPMEQQEKMLEAARARFAGTRPEFAAEAMLVVNNALGRPGVMT